MRLISSKKNIPLKLDLCHTDYLKIKSATGMDPKKLVLISEEDLKQLETLDIENTIRASREDIAAGRVHKWEDVRKELGI